MRRIKVLKAGEVEVDTYRPHSFTQLQDSLSSAELIARLHKKNSKKNIKKIAKRDGLPYDDDKIIFAIEVINTILNEIDDEK